MRSHAIANGVFVAAANRTGLEGDLRILGRFVRLPTPTATSWPGPVMTPKRR